MAHPAPRRARSLANYAVVAPSMMTVAFRCWLNGRTELFDAATALRRPYPSSCAGVVSYGIEEHLLQPVALYLISSSGPLRDFPVDKRKTRERCCRHIGAPTGAPMWHAVLSFHPARFGRWDRLFPHEGRGLRAGRTGTGKTSETPEWATDRGEFPIRGPTGKQVKGGWS
jgi:hypothetical protein